MCYGVVHFTHTWANYHGTLQLLIKSVVKGVKPAWRASDGDDEQVKKNL